jgi:hypothetical protein
MSDRIDEMRGHAVEWLEAKNALLEAEARATRARHDIERARERIAQCAAKLGGCVGRNITTRMVRIPQAEVAVVVRHTNESMPPGIELFNRDGELVR